MRAFKDTKQRNWTLTLNIGAVKRIRSLANVDLLALDQGSPPALTKLALDPVLLCDVVFACVRPQADAAGVTDEEFGESLGNDAISAMHAAFFDELTDFFHQLGRKELVAAIQAQSKVIQKVVERVRAKVDEKNLDQAIDTVLKELDQTSGDMSMNKLGLSA